MTGSRRNWNQIEPKSGCQRAANRVRHYDGFRKPSRHEDQLLPEEANSKTEKFRRYRWGDRGDGAIQNREIQKLREFSDGNWLR